MYKALEQFESLDNSGAALASWGRPRCEVVVILFPFVCMRTQEIELKGEDTPESQRFDHSENSAKVELMQLPLNWHQHFSYKLGLIRQKV